MKKTALILVLALMAGACLPLSQTYRQGVKAEINRDYEEAIRQYQRASLDNPKEPAYKVALVRARASASLFYLQTARTLVAQGKRDEALAAYRKAQLFDPLSRAISEELRNFESPPVKREAPEEIKGPVKLIRAGEPLNLNFRTAVSVRSIFETLGRVSGVNFIYDETFRDTNLAIDLTGKDLEQAISFLCAASKNFYRAVDEKTVIVAPDNPQKRMQYELNAIRTFYLSNVNASDVQGPLTQMITSQFRPPKIQSDKNLNTITVRDTPQGVALASRLLRMWDKPKAEVLIDIELMEVSRIKLQQLGVDFSQTLVGARLNPSQNGVSDEGYIRLKGLNLGDLANYEFSLPSAVLQFLASDGISKLIAQPKIRGISGEEIKYLVGQKVPIPQTTFSPLIAGGTNMQPIVNYTQQDVGIDIKLKPRVHLEREVTIEVEIKISAISGAGIANIPIIATREVKNTIRLKDGETNLLAGLLRDEERKSIGGIAGLKDIPLLGQLFSASDTTIEQTDVVMTITPYIIKPVPLTEEDGKPLWVDPDSLSSMMGGTARGVQGAVAEEGVPDNEALEPEEAGPNAVFLSPASFEAPREREFRVNVEIAAEKEIGNMSLNLSFNPQVLRLKDILEGGVVRQLGERVPFLKNITAGGATLGFTSPTQGRGFKGRGILAVLVFTSVGPGEVDVSISGYSAVGPAGQSVALETGDSRILIR